jgi:hypothetical protein
MSLANLHQPSFDFKTSGRAVVTVSAKGMGA